MKLHFHDSHRWINDPNGLVQLNGWYHLFYQCNPNGITWADMHWGHARSCDLYHWEELPVAMAPDRTKGEEHCFSGSCCLDPEGQPRFFYTSIGSEDAGRGARDGAEQWTACADGPELLHLTQSDIHALRCGIHPELAITDWRDPCVIPWHDEYLMVLGGKHEDRGCILLYRSQDLTDWSFCHILMEDSQPTGRSWECPNLFLFGDKAVVFWSPCGVVQYAVGTLSDGLAFIQETAGVLDPGGYCGFYAPQCFRDAAGRMLMLAWMPECDDGTDTVRRGWSGCMTLPRQLSVVHGELRADPVDGWQSLLCSAATVRVLPGTPFTGEAGACFVLEGSFDARDCWSVQCLVNGKYQTEVRYHAEAIGGILEINRSRSGVMSRADIPVIRRTVPLTAARLSLFLCVDGTTVECAVDGRWCSCRVYPGPGAGGLSILSRCGMELCCYE